MQLLDEYDEQVELTGLIGLRDQPEEEDAEELMALAAAHVGLFDDIA